MDDKQKLKPDLKEIYERVMNTPSKPPVSAQPPQPQTPNPTPSAVPTPPQPAVSAAVPKPPYSTNTQTVQSPSEKEQGFSIASSTQPPQSIPKPQNQQEIMSKEPPFFTLDKSNIDSTPIQGQPVSPTATFSTLVNNPPIPNPVIAKSKPKGSKIWGFLITIFFIVYTAFWLMYFNVVDKTLLGMLTSKLGIKIM